MKKIYSLLSMVFISAVLTAQISITYQVDITDYVTAGNVVGANGIRIGGDFVATGGTNGAAPIPAWVPSDPACAMVDLGSNVWSITVIYPDTSIGKTQLYKFVNNDWGTNEGTDVENTIGADGCGLDDGAGNVNRTLVIPDADAGYQYCWDHCFKCDGSNPFLSIISVNPSVLNLNIAPNPSVNYVAFTYNVQNAENVMLDIFSLMGEHVGNVVNEQQYAGTHSATFNAENLATGTYIYRLQVGNYITSGTIVKN